MRDGIDHVCKEKKKEVYLDSDGDYVDASIQGFENYVKKSKERLITSEKYGFGNINTAKKNYETEIRRKKHLNGYFRDKLVWLQIRNHRQSKESYVQREKLILY